MKICDFLAFFRSKSQKYHCQRVPRYFYPQEIEFLRTFPRLFNLTLLYQNFELKWVKAYPKNPIKPKFFEKNEQQPNF